MISEDAQVKVDEEKKDEKHVKVTLVWGGTGESKEAEVGVDHTAGQVFELIYQRFNQQETEQDTFEIDDKDFPRSRFGETVKSLLQYFGKELVFEVIPPTSGM